MSTVEQFADWHKDIIINPDGRTIAKNRYNWCYHRSCYGKVKIPSHKNCIVTWRLYIKDPLHSDGAICVGIDSVQTTDTKFYLNQSAANYGYESHGKIYAEGKKQVKNMCAKSYEWGDSIWIKLDTGLRLLEFHKKEQYGSKAALQHTCKIKTGSDIKYRLAVCIKDAAVEISNFKMEIRDDLNQLDDAKSNNHSQQYFNQAESAQIISLTKQLSTKEMEFKQLQIDYNGIIQTMRERKQAMMVLDEKIEQKQDYSIHNVSQYINEESAKFQIEFNQSKLTKLRKYNPQKLMVLNENIKQYETNIKNIILSANSFEEYIEATKFTINNLLLPKVCDYENWDIETILIWIGDIENGRYKKYLDVLRTGLIKSEITKGMYLPDLDVATLSVEPFRIHSFPDKRDLVKKFKQLQSEEGNADTVHH
eukprot:522622_1